ncbi:NfeD family protein [Candidatus Symbiobacter mobilis]|uniref:NfeD-like C-terminal domain-containing protein n=1 Tax=Candidatus Symbiobacter mobilis CR TaxID=946483 RepID=U5N8H1_9BURK|nr:NfeD family protein [Candidatus Symbiobacter mobilis]AGX86474.1 hypothetical protein Cenrod_0350 [Candidatus Symbiobacter mobilis CR]
MEPTEATWWWVAAGILVAAELATGTFYLLLIAVGLCAGALSAHAGLPESMQWSAAALVGGATVLAWRSYKSSQPPKLPAQASGDVNLDIGTAVHVERWNDDGSCKLKYRGAQWEGALRTSTGGILPSPGRYYIAAIEGTRLLLEPTPPVSNT